MTDDRSDIMRAGSTAQAPSAGQGRLRRFGWPRRILALVILLSFVVAAFAWIQVLSSVVGAVTEPPQATPGVAERTFSAGRYGVFERTGTSRGAGGITFTENQLPLLRPGDVTITGPTGTVVPARRMDRNETINRNGALYTGMVEFDITEPGRYQVQIGRVQGEVVVTRDFLDGQGSNLVLGLASGFVFLISAAALTIASIVVTMRRRRTERAQWGPSAAMAMPMPAGPPQGWGSAPPTWAPPPPTGPPWSAGAASPPPPPAPPPSSSPPPPPPPWRPDGS